MSKIGFLDIEIYDQQTDWEQGRYLVHGYDDILWTNCIEQACLFLADELGKFKAGNTKEVN